MSLRPTTTLAAVCWTAVSAFGQAADVRRVSVLDPADWLHHLIDYRPASGPVPLLVWERQAGFDPARGAENAVPIPAGRDRIDFGHLREDTLIALAGGLRESLDIYVLTAAGSIRRLATDGGRRLQAGFGGGLGSWPVAIDDQVFVAAYEKAGRIEVRAFGLGQQVFGSRAWPKSVRGFEVGVKGHRIVVRAEGAEVEPLEFSHPQMPRVDVTPALLEFEALPVGEVGERLVRLHNSGQVATRVELVVDREVGFTVEPRSVELGRRSSVEVRVRFKPPNARDHRATLLVRAAGELQASVSLFGAAVAVVPAAPRPEAATEVVVIPGPVDVPESRGARATPVEASASAPLPAALPAPVFTPPELSPPGLVWLGAKLVVEALPGESLVLAQVSAHEVEGKLVPLRVLASWSIRLPRTAATLEIPTATVVSGGAPAHFVVLRRMGDRTAVSPVVEVRRPS